MKEKVHAMLSPLKQCLVDAVFSTLLQWFISFLGNIDDIINYYVLFCFGLIVPAARPVTQLNSIFCVVQFSIPYIWLFSLY